MGNHHVSPTDDLQEDLGRPGWCLLEVHPALVLTPVRLLYSPGDREPSLFCLFTILVHSYYIVARLNLLFSLKLLKNFFVFLEILFIFRAEFKFCSCMRLFIVLYYSCVDYRVAVDKTLFMFFTEK